MTFVCILISLALIISILSPFWIGEGGLLLSSSTYTDPEKILKIRKLIVSSYISDENAHKEGYISKGEWLKRSQYLFNRYLDLTRRYDHLIYVETLEKQTPSQADEENS